MCASISIRTMCPHMRCGQEKKLNSNYKMYASPTSIDYTMIFRRKQVSQRIFSLLLFGFALKQILSVFQIIGQRKRKQKRNV